MCEVLSLTPALKKKKKRKQEKAVAVSTVTTASASQVTMEPKVKEQLLDPKAKEEQGITVQVLGIPTFFVK